MAAISLDSLADRAEAAPAAGTRSDRRILIGITGPPAAGKSTLAANLSAALNARHDGRAAVAAMDGFHLTTAAIESMGALGRKGQPDTFDVHGFLQRLRLLRDSAPGTPVEWPVYDRGLHNPVPAGVIFTNHTIAIVEGNYLLLGTGHWAQVRDLLNEVWYLDAPTAVIYQRLMRRHVLGGKTIEAAERKTRDSDLPNARLIAETAQRADLVLRAVDETHFRRAGG